MDLSSLTYIVGGGLGLALALTIPYNLLAWWAAALNSKLTKKRGGIAGQLQNGLWAALMRRQLALAAVGVLGSFSHGPEGGAVGVVSALVWLVVMGSLAALAIRNLAARAARAPAPTARGASEAPPPPGPIRHPAPSGAAGFDRGTSPHTSFSVGSPTATGYTFAWGVPALAGPPAPGPGDVASAPPSPPSPEGLGTYAIVLIVFVAGVTLVGMFSVEPGNSRRGTLPGAAARALPASTPPPAPTAAPTPTPPAPAAEPSLATSPRPEPADAGRLTEAAAQFQSQWEEMLMRLTQLCERFDAAFTAGGNGRDEDRVYQCRVRATDLRRASLYARDALRAYGQALAAERAAVAQTAEWRRFAEVADQATFKAWSFAQLCEDAVTSARGLKWSGQSGELIAAAAKGREAAREAIGHLDVTRDMLVGALYPETGAPGGSFRAQALGPGWTVHVSPWRDYAVAKPAGSFPIEDPNPNSVDAMYGLAAETSASGSTETTPGYYAWTEMFLPGHGIEEMHARSLTKEGGLAAIVIWHAGDARGFTTITWKGSPNGRDDTYVLRVVRDGSSVRCLRLIWGSGREPARWREMLARFPARAP